MSANLAAELVERQIIRLCHSGLDARALRLEVFEHLQRAMPYEAYWAATTDPETLLFNSAVSVGFDPRVVPAYIGNEFLEDDFNKFTDLALGPHSVSTLLTATHGDLMRSQRYREILEPVGLGNEMRAVFRTGGSVWGAMCLHRLKRDRDFTPADVALFTAIAPHLAAGLRGALLLDVAEISPAGDGPGLLLLADDLTVVSTTPGAELLLDEVSGWTRNDALPLPVYAVVNKLRGLERDAQGTACAIPHAHLRSRAGRWLSLHASRLSTSTPAGQIAVIIDLATPNDIAPLVLQAYALTAREQAVASLVLKGRSTEAIAAHLCISMLTVQQHLKAIFDKLGVRSRRDLVAHVFARSYWPDLAAEQGISPDRWSPA